MIENDLQRNQELNLREKERAIAAANQNSAVARIVNLVYFVFGILEFLLAIRVILKLVGANGANGFANFIYGLSAPFVALFANLVQNPVFNTTAIVEITTIIAMLVYAIIAGLVGRFVWLILSRPR